jgi:DNA-directed RNA polymerase specialized sigma24 family protein
MFSRHENNFACLDLVDLHKHLFILTPLDHSILELCFLRGFTCPEVAKLLGLPLKATR